MGVTRTQPEIAQLQLDSRQQQMEAWLFPPLEVRGLAAREIDRLELR